MTSWEYIKNHYITTDLSGAAVARQFRVSPKEVTRRIREEGWDQLRRDYRCEKTARALLALRSERDWRLGRVDSLADGLLGCLERAVGELDLVTVNCKEKVKTDTGEQVREFQRILPGEPGAVDRGGLKQLTAVLKDIKDVLVLRPESDIREQEARIAKLQRDLQKQEASDIRVQLEGGLDGYAD